MISCCALALSLDAFEIFVPSACAYQGNLTVLVVKLVRLTRNSVLHIPLSCIIIYKNCAHLLFYTYAHFRAFSWIPFINADTLVSLIYRRLKRRSIFVTRFCIMRYVIWRLRMHFTVRWHEPQ